MNVWTLNKEDGWWPAVLKIPTKFEKSYFWGFSWMKHYCNIHIFNIVNYELVAWYNHYHLSDVQASSFTFHQSWITTYAGAILTYYHQKLWIYFCLYKAWESIFCNGRLNIGENVYMKENKTENFFLKNPDLNVNLKAVLH